MKQQEQIEQEAHRTMNELNIKGKNKRKTYQ